MRIGAISKADIQSSAKNQLILPVKYHVVQLLIQQCHEISNLGTEYVLSAIRQRFWVINGRVSVKHISRRCMVCKRRKARPNEPFMSTLPSFRVEQGNPPFFKSGVDFFGPIYVKQKRSRVKRWGCIFVCMSVRAVHIELAESLDTDSFINAMQRFINRRGRPSLIVSDCGTNFKGAVNELEMETSKLDHNKVGNKMAHQKIQWLFNPPSSPHMGGSWERMIRTVKEAMFAIIKDRILTDFQMLTLFSEVENIVNNRPLTYLSEDHEDLEALTPNHFLIGRNFYNDCLVNDICNKDVCSRKRWRQVQILSDHFWKRWLHEYLPSLTLRSKWRAQKERININDLVLIKEDNIKRGQWPLGRIVELHPGEDGVVRVVTVQTSKGTYKRPAVKILRLENDGKFEVPQDGGNVR